MFQGHGGHGSVVAAKLLAQAAARGGWQAQSFATYGALRRGGKVDGYVRISGERLLLRCKMYEADYLVIMDESLVDEEGTPKALKQEGKVLINTMRPGRSFPFLERFKVFTLDAYGIAREMGLVIPGGMPVINTTVLGALAGIMQELSISDVIEAIKQGTPNPDKNAACAVEGFRRIADSLFEEKPNDQAGRSVHGVAANRIPVFIPEKMGPCERCQICYISCPNLAIRFEADPFRFHILKEFCAGCGICIHECPRHAIAWEG